MANLIFKSGFEGVSLGPQINDFIQIEGTDSATGFTWPTFSSGFWNSSANGIHTINNDKGNVYTNQLVQRLDHNSQVNTVLKTGIDAFANPYWNCQTPYVINLIGGPDGQPGWGTDQEPKKIYHKFWIQLDDMAVVKSTPGGWRMIWQYKSINWDDGWCGAGCPDTDGYRISLFIFRDGVGDLYWRTQADWGPNGTQNWWAINNTTLPVPTEEWFSVEIYWVGSDGKSSSDGDFWIKINGTKIANNSSPGIGAVYAPDTETEALRRKTFGSNNPITFNGVVQTPGVKAPDNLNYWTLWQFYSGQTGVQYISEVEIWDDIPSTDTTAPSVDTLAVSQIRDDSFLVTLDADEATSLELEYGTTTGIYDRIIPPINIFATTQQYRVGNSIKLTHNTTYYWRIKLEDATGNIAYSTEQTTTTLEKLPRNNRPHKFGSNRLAAGYIGPIKAIK